MKPNISKSILVIFVLMISWNMSTVKVHGKMVEGNSRSIAEDSSKGKIIATVNGVKIYDAELQKVLKEYRKRAGTNQISDELKKNLLRNIIRRHLILNQDIVKQLRNDPEIRKRVRNYEDSLIVARFLENEIGSKIKVNDKEIEKYYWEHRSEFATPPRVAARHILLRSREDAEKVLQKLKAGEDFGKLAREYSIDLPMALEGGSMGIIEKGKTLPELEKVLFSLKVGEYSDIVKTRFGYHIITVDRIYPTQFKKLSEVRDEIKRRLAKQKEAEAFETMVRRLEKNAKIEIFDEYLTTQHSSP